MKLKNLLSLAAIVSIAFASCNKEDQSSEAGMKITPSELSFAADTLLSQTVAVTSSREWKVTGAPEWASFDVNGKDVTKESVAASASPVTMTVTVLKNTGAERSQTVKVNGGTLAYQNLTIKQAGISCKGTGTKEDPFNVAAAVAKAVEVGSSAPSTEYYYIKGYVTTVKEVSTDYGNATFWIGDAKGATEGLLYCFQVGYIGGKSFTSADQIKVDDEVVMYAQVYNYKDNTPETSGKSKSYIYTLNGEGGGEAPDPTKAEYKTIAQFLQIADPDTYYKLEGTISNFNETYCSFDLTDETGEVYVYSVTDSIKAVYASVLHDGYSVTLSGKYKKYQETDEVVDAVILEYEAVPYLIVTPENQNVTAADTTAKVTLSTNITNYQIEASYGASFQQDPATNEITVFFPANTTSEEKTYSLTVTPYGEYESLGVKTATIIQFGKPEGDVLELTNDEIKESFASCNLSAYSDWTITSQSGDWVGSMYCKKGLEYVQLRNTMKACITTPLFSKEIEKIEFTMNSGTAKVQNRNIYAVPVGTDLTTADKDHYYQPEVISNAYGNVAVETNSGKTFEMTVAAGVKQATLISYMESGSGALYIKSIKVYFKAE